MLIDIHTHLNAKRDAKNDHLAFQVDIHSQGIHPWNVLSPFDQKKSEDEFLLLKQKWHPGILAIGECGLDRRREGLADIEEQMRVLEWHMDWAQETHRPLILHCVKAESDLLGALKKKNYRGKILLHDFGGNLDHAKAFLHYDAYFSFGKSLFRKDGKAASVFLGIPKERLFLESDNHENHTLLEIYQKAQEILNLDLKDLEKLF
ncbi:MAG: TatD family hydrolase, partial [Bacteriovorax sp.]